MASKTEVIKVLGFLHISFPEFEISEAAIDVYFAILNDISFEALQSAAIAYTSGHDARFFPKPGQLRGVAFGLTEKPELNGIEAWGELTRQISRCGHNAYRHAGALKPVFTSKTLEDLVTAIGWERCCEMQDSDIMRSTFAKQYNEIAKEATEHSRMLPAVREFKEDNMRKIAAGISRDIMRLKEAERESEDEQF